MHNYGRWHEDVNPMDKGFDVGGRNILYFDAMEGTARLEGARC